MSAPSAAAPANDNQPPEASRKALADAIRRDDRWELRRLMRAIGFRDEVSS